VRIHHLNCATMCPPMAAFTERGGSPFKRGRLVCHCLLVESRAGLLLVDTGLGTADLRDPRLRLGAPFVALTGPLLDPAETAVSQVRALGFSPDDVRHILPTHLDLDHAGGLSDFPRASVHVLGREREAARARPTAPERMRYRPAQWAHVADALWQVHEPSAGESWFGFEGVRPLAGTEDEVLLIPLYGHTRGHAGVAVRGERGWVLHAGDAYFHRGSVHPEGEPVPFGLKLFERAMQTLPKERVRNVARLRELARSAGSEVRVVCAHDPVELAQCQRAGS
jgi:glyoxylase-like metal-dependent hydrolase (beta-lactamase superfamily II)